MYTPLEARKADSFRYLVLALLWRRYIFLKLINKRINKMQHRFGMCSANNNNNKKTPKIKQKIQNKLTTKEHGHGRRKGREEKLLTGAPEAVFLGFQFTVN